MVCAIGCVEFGFVGGEWCWFECSMSDEGVSDREVDGCGYGEGWFLGVTLIL